MGLSGQQRKELQDALIDAFPDKSSLEQMLSFELDKSLDTIAGGNNLQDIVFNLIKKAEAENWVENLIDAALLSNPRNQLLAKINEEINIEKNKLNVIKPSNPMVIRLENIPRNGFQASEVGVDYTQLAMKLYAQDFKAADKETAKVMLWVARREKEGFLRGQDIEKFPCRDLGTIDQLWLASSGGKFGFSVQKQIYLECDKNWDSFCDRVRWTLEGRYLSYSELNWDLRGMWGHLPYPIFLSFWVTPFGDECVNDGRGKLPTNTMDRVIKDIFRFKRKAEDDFIRGIFRGDFRRRYPAGVKEGYSSLAQRLSNCNI